MMNKENFNSIPEDIINLLAKRATGSLSETESQVLHEWLCLNPEKANQSNRFTEAFNRLYWTYLAQNISNPQTIVDRAFSKKPKSRRLITRYLAYAAIILLLLGFGWSLYKQYIKEETIEITEQQTIERHNKAMLILSDGNSLILDSPENTELADANGVRIRNNPGELLQYEQDENQLNQLKKNRLIIPVGARYQLKLSDGTQVWMNSLSELEYPVAFASNERRVKLSGEAYFVVKPKPESDFIIEANGYEIRVTGTSLNVSAYEVDGYMHTTLVSGTVDVQSRLGQWQKLRPGQMALINNENQEILVEEVDPRYYTSWREGILYFNKISLQDLATKLERWYDVDITFTNDGTKGLLFSGAMENSRNIEFLLFLIGQASKVEFEINNNQIRVK
jgi:ferric-dicitrate binding protein FerR (iron transport regulator)